MRSSLKGVTGSDYRLPVTKIHAFAFVFAAACAHVNPGPTVVLRLDSSWTAATKQSADNGMAAWVRLGFRWSYTAIPSLTECRRDWYKVGAHDCTITIGMSRVAGLADGLAGRVDGMASRELQVIDVDAKWTEWALAAIVAHELGHILLATDEHLSAGAVGVMAARGAAWDPTQADFDLACRTIGICVKL